MNYCANNNKFEATRAAPIKAALGAALANFNFPWGFVRRARTPHERNQMAQSAEFILLVHTMSREFVGSLGANFY